MRDSEGFDGHIEELVLRLPGLDATSAAEVGARVARAVGERLSRTPGLRSAPEGLDLRLEVGAEVSRDRIVSLVTEAIVSRLTGAPGRERT